MADTGSRAYATSTEQPDSPVSEDG